MSFTAIKFGWGPIGKDEAHDVRLARAAKEAAGKDVEILIDAGFGYGADADRAIRVARELEKLGIYWLEEPFEPDEFEAYAKLADAVDMRVAAGEEESTRWGFRELAERGQVDVLQPDVTRCGGLSEALRIAQRCADPWHRVRAPRLEERHHQGGFAAPQCRAAHGVVPGILRGGDPDQPAAHAGAHADRRRLGQGARRVRGSASSSTRRSSRGMPSVPSRSPSSGDRDALQLPGLQLAPLACLRAARDDCHGASAGERGRVAHADGRRRRRRCRRGRRRRARRGRALPDRPGRRCLCPDLPRRRTPVSSRSMPADRRRPPRRCDRLSRARVCARCRDTARSPGPCPAAWTAGRRCSRRYGTRVARLRAAGGDPLRRDGFRGRAR